MDKEYIKAYVVEYVYYFTPLWVFYSNLVARRARDVYVESIIIAAQSFERYKEKLLEELKEHSEYEELIIESRKPKQKLKKAPVCYRSFSKPLAYTVPNQMIYRRKI